MNTDWSTVVQARAIQKTELISRMKQQFRSKEDWATWLKMHCKQILQNITYCSMPILHASNKACYFGILCFCCQGRQTTQSIKRV